MRAHSSLDDSILPARIAFHAATRMGELFFKHTYTNSKWIPSPVLHMIRIFIRRYALEPRSILSKSFMNEISIEHCCRIFRVESMLLGILMMSGFANCTGQSAVWDAGAISARMYDGYSFKVGTDFSSVD